MNRRGFRLLHIADLTLVYVTLFALTGAMILVRPQFNAMHHLGRYLWTYALVAVIHLVVFSLGGLYDREPRLVARPSTSRLVALVWIASLVVGVASWLMGEFLIPRSVLLIYAIIGPLGLNLNRWSSRRLRDRANGPARILLIGSRSEAEQARTHFDAWPYAVVVGHTETTAGLETLVTSAGATDVLLLDGDQLRRLYSDALSRLERQGVEALQVVRPHDSLLGLRTVGEVAGLPVVSLSAHVLTQSQRRVKRMMDVGILILTSPLALLATLITLAFVAVRAGRPLLFVQPRVGLDGVPFQMLKFRTMRPNSELPGRPQQAVANDPRIITGLGWLRSSRLDELPQLINVLRGEMTIVGPRPERPEEMHAYEEVIPGYSRRHQIEPGITGLAQVYGHYNTHPEYKLGYDLQYLANWSPLVDLQIMIRTAWVIVTGRL